jgi:methylenetetrahydrofolate dehydrogenase (NADP+) / methenyltetrahydrofolate cyclohydrolase
MRILNGQELAGFIKERQAKQVRGLRQAHKVFPRLAIIRTSENPAIASYVRLKQAYGADILIDVNEHFVGQSDALELIKKLNVDPLVHGIILQLPLADQTNTDELLNMVAPTKDVDGLGQKAIFQPATPMAILWLLAGYNIELTGKKIVVVGQGRLVGKPLTASLSAQGYNVTAVDEKTDNAEQIERSADVLITGVGVPGLIKGKNIKPSAVVIDAGVATDKGELVGDLAPDVRERNDLTITPPKGGVGPLTVCALFDNVIRAAYSAAKQSE